METSLTLVLKSPSSEHTSMLLSFLGDDAPIFADEVPCEWRPIFEIIENIVPPEEICKLSEQYVVMDWNTSNWQEELQDIAPLLEQAGFMEFSIYYWEDEDEGFILWQKGRPTEIKPILDSALTVDTLPGLENWGDEDDQETVLLLVSCLPPKIGNPPKNNRTD